VKADYLPIVVLGLLGVVFVLLSIVVSRLLAPQRTTAIKRHPYESGITDTVSLPDRFPVRFYLVAMLFIMFDIEIVFLYPYAVSHDTLGYYGFWAVLAFSVVFFATFVYEVARGGLDWGPIGRVRDLTADAAMVTSDRTLTSTVRRVGTEGRQPVDEEAA
jgi:NADH-quinone oxidoreductase subunit A